jgi:hypothetical protein
MIQLTRRPGSSKHWIVLSRKRSTSYRDSSPAPHDLVDGKMEQLDPEGSGQKSLVESGLHGLELGA